jgi:hypothetical protein
MLGRSKDGTSRGELRLPSEIEQKARTRFVAVAKIGGHSPRSCIKQQLAQGLNAADVVIAG